MTSVAAKSSGINEALLEKFEQLVAKDVDAQAEFFLTSFIFDLDANWKEVVVLSKKFKEYLASRGETHDLDAVQASDFLQKNGVTRTGPERKQELRDVDLNFDDRICMTEYYLLHFQTHDSQSIL